MYFKPELNEFLARKCFEHVRGGTTNLCDELNQKFHRAYSKLMGIN